MIWLAIFLSVILSESESSPADWMSFGSLFADENKSFKKVLDEYTFVADFTQKEETPKISEEIFWRYPFKLPQIKFPINFDVKNYDQKIMRTEGSGRAIEHLNKGRLALLSGRYEEAKNFWLSGRAQYSKDFKYDRRLDYFLSQAYLQLGAEKSKKGIDPNDKPTENMFSAATTFLSWAFIVKKDNKDDPVHALSPENLYNLSAIYFYFDRFSASFGAAQEGINYLNSSGRKDYRTMFHRILAESFIKNRTYLEAIQEFDTAIRQDPDPEQAALMFNRAGDIYFDLNNFYLANDSYELAEKVFSTTPQNLEPLQLILRAESNFWTGHFAKAREILKRAIDLSPLKNNPLSKPDLSYALLRLADTYLADSAKAKSSDERKKLLESAKLAYFRVESDYRSTDAAQAAKIRLACLELPDYDGKNVDHARKLLEESKKQNLNEPLNEIVYSCHVGSYSQRERTDAMLSRVRDFSLKYPKSRFLAQLVGPVRETQSVKILPLFKSSPHDAVLFFEKNEKNLFPKITPEIGAKLFKSYVDIYLSHKAIRFWQFAQNSLESDQAYLRAMTFFSEVDLAKNPKLKNEITKVRQKLEKRKWNTDANPNLQSYVWRILESKDSSKNLDWIYSLSTFWSDRSYESACTASFPLISKMLQQKNNSKQKIKLIESHVADIIKKHLPDGLDKDAGCAEGLMLLEYRFYNDRLIELAKKYIERPKWLSHETFRSQVYALAETFAQKEKSQNAETLWRFLVDQAPADSVEVKFSKARLDQQKTVYDSLWDSTP